MRQRNRDYLAPWRQDRISQDFLAALTKQVEAELAITAVDLDWVAAAPVCARHTQEEDAAQELPGGGLKKHDLKRADTAADRQCLLELRARLVARFGTLRYAFQVMDYNKDGALTYGELRSMLVRVGFGGQEATWERDLRAAFSALDSNRSGNLTLNEWLRESSEDGRTANPERGTAVGSEESRQAKKAVPLEERPSWTTRKAGTTALGHAMLDLQKEDDPLPQRSQSAATPKKKRDATLGVWARTEEILQRRQRTVQQHAQKNEEEHAKAMTLRPELSVSSKKIMKGKHVKPWEGRQWDHERIFERRMRQDRAEAEAKVAEAHTFQPQVQWRSMELFKQLADDGDAWHDRMHNRSKGVKNDRMNLSFKKLTPDFEETWLRERVPEISKNAKNRARSADEPRDVHRRLHENLGRTARSFTEDDGVGRYMRTTSFTTRPAPAYARPRSAGPCLSGRQLSASSATGTYAGGAEDDISPVRTEVTTATTPTASPVRGGAPSAASTSASAFDPPPSPVKHKVVASPHLVDLLAACGPHARCLDLDVSDLSLYGAGHRSRQ